MQLKTDAYLKLKIVPTVSNRFNNIQVDYPPKLVDTGFHRTIKDANEAIKEMNASVSGYKSPYVSICNLSVLTLGEVCVLGN